MTGSYQATKLVGFSLGAIYAQHRTLIWPMAFRELISIWQVCMTTTISYLTYAAPAWWGYTDACARLRLQSVFNRLRRFGLLPPEFPTHEELYVSSEHLCGELFRHVLHNRMHVLHQLLPPVKETPYGLRPSSHNRIIPRADHRFRRNFIIRMLYK